MSYSSIGRSSKIGCALIDFPSINGRFSTMGQIDQLLNMAWPASSCSMGREATETNPEQVATPALKGSQKENSAKVEPLKY